MRKNTYPMNITTGVVQAPPSTGKPPAVNKSFDCAARKLAYEYAQILRPDKGDLRIVHDGLQLLGKEEYELERVGTYQVKIDHVRTFDNAA